MNTSTKSTNPYKEVILSNKNSPDDNNKNSNSDEVNICIESPNLPEEDNKKTRNLLIIITKYSLRKQQIHMKKLFYPTRIHLTITTTFQIPTK